MGPPKYVFQGPLMNLIMLWSFSSFDRLKLNILAPRYKDCRSFNPSKYLSDTRHQTTFLKDTTTFEITLNS